MSSTEPTKTARAIRLLSENPLEQIDIYLSTWESANAARSLVRERASRKSIALSEDKAVSKGLGVAYCLRNAREFFMAGSGDSTGRVLASYYGLMSFLGAIMIADPENDFDLAMLERATSRGHGLGSIDDLDAPFPEAQMAYVKDTGFFTHYLRFIGVDHHPFCLHKRPDAPQLHSEEISSKLVSLGGLLARIPEMAALYFEVTGKLPLNVHVFSSTKNDDEASKRRIAAHHSKGVDADSDAEMQSTWVGLGSQAEMTAEFITNELSVPLNDIAIYKDGPHDGRYWHGRVELAKGPYFRESGTVTRFREASGHLGIFRPPI